MAELDINKLYKLACEGDPHGVERLFENLSARFRLFARQRIRDGLDAEDVVQDALATILKEYRSVTVKVSFAAWAYKVLDNRILGYIQGKRRRADRVGRVTEGDCGSMAGYVNTQPDLKRRLLECLQKIGRANMRYARILTLHYQGYTTKEICKKLQLTRSNFYSVLSRARSMLEICLEKGDVR